MMRFSLIDSAVNWLCLEFGYWLGYLDSFKLLLHMEQILPKSSHHSSEVPIISISWYAWIQSSAMFKQQHVRLCGFRWSIPLSIGNFWSPILIALYRLLDTYIAYTYLYKTSPLITCLIWKTISHSGLPWNASLDGDGRYIDRRSEWEDIRCSGEIWDLYIYIYIYILYL